MIPEYSPTFSQYTGTGQRKFFEYGFDTTFDFEVLVLVDNKLVTFKKQETGVALDVAPAVGAIVVIYRFTLVDQLLDFQPFEAFPAAKTEFFMDKLITLKKEALDYRANLNLIANPTLEKVIIVNDKGDDAELIYWGTGRTSNAGMFGAEVTTDMPPAGAIVDKPEDFAYLQYGDMEILEDVLTTTLYPLEAVEGTEFGIDLELGAMGPIPEDDADHSMYALGGSVLETLLSHGPIDDDADHSMFPNSGEVLETLLSAGPFDDDADHRMEALGGEVTEFLVQIYSPEEGSEFGIDLDPANSFMTPV